MVWGQKGVVNQVKEWLIRAATKVEQNTISLWWYILGFLAIVFLRVFYDVFFASSFPVEEELFSAVLLSAAHYSWFFISVSLFICCCFVLFGKQPIHAIKLCCFVIVVVLLVPLVDVVNSQGQGTIITYLLPSQHGNYLDNYLGYFGPYEGTGVSLGMKIEILVALLGAAVYLYLFRKNVLLSVVFGLVLYSIIFFFISFPYFVEWVLEFFEPAGHHFDIIMIQFHSLFIGLGLACLFWGVNKKTVIELLRDLRYAKLGAYLLLYLGGVYIAVIHGYVITQSHILSLVLTGVALCLGWLFSVMTNNIADVRIDKISNRKRPLITKSITYEKYVLYTWIVGVLALLFSAVASLLTFFLVIVFMGNYVLYSLPPFRLKKILFVSKIPIAINVFIVMYLGYLLLRQWPGGFPSDVGWIVVLCALLLSHVHDLKDYKGDKKERMWTLPVIFGLQKAKHLIGVFFVFCYLLIASIIGQPIVFLQFFVLGLVQYYLCVKKKYRQWTISLVVILSMVVFFLNVLWFDYAFSSEFWERTLFYLRSR